jgi:transcriptional regulator with XRE-family HTH domain
MAIINFMKNNDETKTKEGFPERLLSLRKQKNLSQTELGKIVGVHYSHIGRYKRGISRPAADTLKKWQMH